MINIIKLIFFSFLLIDTCFAGVTVVGTRFYINNETKALNIKLMNDNDSDYLVKTNINSDGFIITPPLLILQKNSNNIISIIPNDRAKFDMDMIYTLTVMTIPKASAAGNNSVSMAVRSHFKLIYQHKKPVAKDFYKIELQRSGNGGWFLKNPTLFALNLNISNPGVSNDKHLKLLLPGENFPVNNLCPNKHCSLLVEFLDNENSIIMKRHLNSD